jgi:hypothetical protein
MPKKKKTPTESPDALAARTLAEVEARAAAAHARVLAEAEAAAETSSQETAPNDDSPFAIAARISGPHPVGWNDDDEDDDEDAYDDRWDDATYAHHRGPRRPLRERARGRSGVVELLMFRIGTERFAVELSSVEEAIDLPDVHHVPEMPPAMIGVITRSACASSTAAPRSSSARYAAASPSRSTTSTT